VKKAWQYVEFWEKAGHLSSACTLVFGCGTELMRGTRQQMRQSWRCADVLCAVLNISIPVHWSY